MALKLGGEMELNEVEVKTSTIEGQKLFLELIREMKPEVCSDLVRLFNVEAISPKILEFQDEVDQIAKLSLMFMVKNITPDLSQSNLDKIGLDKDFYKTPLWAFHDFIYKNYEEYKRIYAEKKKFWEEFSPDSPDNLIENSTLREMIPDWNTLQTMNGSEQLCQLIEEWGQKWNLTDDWCLTFALKCLCEFKTNFLDEHTFSDDFFEQNNSSWLFLREIYLKCQTGFGWNHAIWFYDEDQLHRDTFFTSQIKSYPYFTFNYMVKGRTRKTLAFSVEGRYDPLMMQPEEFRERMHKQFLTQFAEYYQQNYDPLVGQLRELADKLVQFENSIDKYLKRTKKEVEKYASNTIKKQNDRHFRWLLEYQIPPVTTYQGLSNKHSFDRKTIKEGIESVSTLINLTMRQRALGGRKLGTQEMNKRRRTLK